MTAAKVQAPIAESPALPMSGRVQHIYLDDLRVAEWNARKTFSQEAQSELTQSVKQIGIVTPLIARLLPASSSHSIADAEKIERGELYEIVAGHRRFDAAFTLGLATVPCIVRSFTDEEARDIGLIDNLQRENVPPIEEAQAFSELLPRLGSIAAVAARVNKDQAYVAKRLKLCTLSLSCQDALREKFITIDHALLLARVGADEQDELLKWCLEPHAGAKKKVDEILDELIRQRAEIIEERGKDSRAYFDEEFEPESVVRLKARMQEESGTLLSRAPWPLDEDYLIPDDPICIECPQNTQANVPLFGDLAIGEPTCTDGGCFKSKTHSFVHIKICDATRDADQAALAAGKTPQQNSILQVSWESTSTAPRLDKDTGKPTLKQTFKAGQWTEAKKKCEHVRPAVTVDWSDANDRGYMGGRGELRKPGEILSVCIEPKCKVHPKAYENAGKSANRKEGESREMRQERERKELEAFRAKEHPVRRALYDAIAAKIPADALKRQMLSACELSNLCLGLGLETKDYSDMKRKAEAAMAAAKPAELDRLLFHGYFGDELEAERYHRTAKDKGRAKLRELAKLAGVDAAAIERKFDQPTAEKPAKADGKILSDATVTRIKKAQKKASVAAKKAAKKASKKAGRK